MPTYSYRCTECGEAFDIVQSFTDDTLTVCPNCGGVLRKVFSPVGVSFSGSGFYRTDSRSAETKKKDAASSGDSSPKATETASAPSASAPATSTPAATSKTPPKKIDKKKES